MRSTPQDDTAKTPTSKGIAARYTVLAYAFAWVAWGCAWIARATPLSGLAWAPFVSNIALVAGTLAPLAATYVLFPSLVTCGIVSDAGQKSKKSTDKRTGFWRYALSIHPSLRAFVVLGLLLVWRYAMFRWAFGFPATPIAALKSFVSGLPLLLLGGGLEEIGWRGCLQPSLNEQARLSSSSAHIRVVLAPALVGIIWGFWHLPLFAIPGTFQTRIPLWSVILVGVCLSYSLELTRQYTGGTLCCILLHAWYNAMLVSTPVFTGFAAALFAVEALVSACALALIDHDRRKKSQMIGSRDRDGARIKG